VCCADDTYLHGAPHIVYKAFARKKEEAEPLGLKSHPKKVAAYSRSNDQTHIPSDMRRSNCITAIGSWFGDATECSAALLKHLTDKLKNLDNLDLLEDAEYYINSTKQKMDLLYSCAAAMPNHNLRTMHPNITEAAATAVDTRITESYKSLSDANLTPNTRTKLMTDVLRLPRKMGGLALTTAHTTRTAAWLASIIATWPLLQKTVPQLAAHTLHTRRSQLATDFRFHYSTLRAQRDSAASEESRRDGQLGRRRTHPRSRRYRLGWPSGGRL
jgi:hypothetical protein